MVLSPVSILGGDSVYCINEAQMNQAKQLAEEDPSGSTYTVTSSYTERKIVR